MTSYFLPKLFKLLMFVLLVSMPGFSTSLVAEETDFVTIPQETIEFQWVPGIPGLAAAVLIGDPNTGGSYVMRVRFSDGMMSPPHTHDRDRTVTVISGTWYFGTDASGLCENAVPLEAGSVAIHPAGKVHYDGSCGGEVVVQVAGNGPVKTQFLADQNAD